MGSDSREEDQGERRCDRARPEKGEEWDVRTAQLQLSWGDGMRTHHLSFGYLRARLG